MTTNDEQLREQIENIELYTTDGTAIDWIHPEHLDKIMSLVEQHEAQAVLAAREIFIPVKGYEGLYEVSNFGNVKSVAGGRRSGGLLRQHLRGTKVDYMCVSLCKDGKSKVINVHRLVAEAFISNPENKRTVNHKDGDGCNNNVDNLEWATYSENTIHSFRILGRVNSKSKLSWEAAAEIKVLLDKKVLMADIAERYGVDHTLISKIKRGVSWNKTIEAQQASQKGTQE